LASYHRLREVVAVLNRPLPREVVAVLNRPLPREVMAVLLPCRRLLIRALQMRQRQRRQRRQPVVQVMQQARCLARKKIQYLMEQPHLGRMV
jgi:hypothetical protein